jgi:RHS repeat-associated protein
LSNDGFVTAKPLFNGNIASMVVNIPKLGDAKIYGYKYDQLNRLTGMDAYNGLNNSTNVFTPAASDDYKERFSYDPNGNILSLVRNGTTQGSRPLLMDSLTYQYEKNTAGQIISNKLRYVHDKISDLNYTEDIDSQTPLTLSAVQSEHLPSQSNDNYQYDAIGNLTKDVKEHIINIDWNVYGKIEKIEKDSGIIIQYRYDAGGNRIGKIVNGKETWYVRDAQGNVMGVYSKEPNVNNGNLSRIEAHMYGSSRLGMYTRPIDVQQPSLINTWERGWKLYEGTNHLGNVLLTISDKKIAHNAGNGLIDYYSADIVTANDYYSGGMEMKGRNYQAGVISYRYSINGKEHDDEVKGSGNSIDFGDRMYDSRIVTWTSLDKLQDKHPGESPYLFVGGNPIVFIDPDGKDRIITTHTTREFADGTSVTVTRTKVITGLGTYQKVQIYDAHGKPTGRYEYHDIYETKTTIYNSKGQNAGGSASALTGNNVQFTSDNDLDTRWGRLVESLYDRSDRNEGHRKGGGGIEFTSKYGQGGGPSADFTDAQMENIDGIMNAFGMAGDVANFESFRVKLTEIFTKKGIVKSEAALFITDKIQDFFKQKIDKVKDKMEETYEPGSDSCGACHKVLPASSMNNPNNPSENYHTDKQKTKSTNKVQKDKTE